MSFVFVLLAVLIALTGCGAGGYAGGGSTSVSSSALTIDANQSVAVTASANGGTISWALGNCTGTCGSLSASTGNRVSYIAPTTLTAPIKVALVASLAGTKSTQTTTITVNPQPVISADVPNGVVGTNYSAWIKASGGTPPLKVSLTSSSLPGGLTFDAGTGQITGVPTASGAWSITAQVADASDVSYTMTWNQNIVISSPAPAQVTVNGSTPNGTVNTPYAATIVADGGKAPYAYGLGFGSLPAGLTLSSTGAISGTPTIAGTFVFVVQAQDANGNKGTNSFSITIDPATLKLSLASLPNGSVGSPYQAVLGVTGGTAPYTCSVASGSLPSGLNFGSSCMVTGIPTISGTSNFAVRVADTASPMQTLTANLSMTVAPAALAISTGNLSNGTVGTPYSSAVGITGGVASYSCSLTSGTLPSGLSLGAACTVTGTPSVAGTFVLGIRVSDSASPANSVNGQVNLSIAPAALVLASGTLPGGTVGTAYSSPISVTGGTAPYSCAVVSGNLPAGLTLGAGCLVSGVPTLADTETLFIRATDSSNPVLSATGTVSLTIAPLPLSLSASALVDGTVGSPYSATIGVTGGTAPYTCSIASGILPLGLSLGARCVVSGVPLLAGTSHFTVRVTDSSNPSLSATGVVSLAIDPVALNIPVSVLLSGVVGTPYAGSVGVTGGTSPYACALISGTLPAGLSFGADCSITGTPAAAGTFNLNVRVTDSTAPTPLSVSGAVSLTINPAPLSISTSTLPSGTVNVSYSSAVSATGGTAPYTCVLVAGALPTGLALGNDCSVTGIPSAAAAANFVVKLTDAGIPALSATTIVTLTIAPAPLVLTTNSLPDGTVASLYTSNINISGGAAPYVCSLTSGALPLGLLLGPNCLLTGFPLTSGTTNFRIKVTDASIPSLTTNGAFSITIAPIALSLTTSLLIDGTVGIPYVAPLGLTGGTNPYTCLQISGTLPAGLSLGANCTIAGTPTQAGTFTITAKVTDSTTPAPLNVSASVSVTIHPSPVALIVGQLPSGTLNVLYHSVLPVSGGTAPYTCSLIVGALPTGLSLASDCSMTGTPLVTGSTNFSVKVNDASSPQVSTTAQVSLAINAAPATLTIAGTLPNATAGMPYLQTLSVTGGTAPYNCVIISGSLPAGLLLGPACVITGIPTAQAATTITVKATDSSVPFLTATGPVNVAVDPMPALTLTGSLPSAVLNLPYAQTLHAAGGVPPYTYAVTAGSLPAGLTLSANGEITGTPTAPGASSFAITATDSQLVPTTASLPLLVMVAYPRTPQDVLLTGPYAFLFQGYDEALAGVLAYQTATVGSFNADGAGLANAGELDSNHQASLAPSNTISSNAFIGTYTIGADNRGFLTTSILNSDGTVGGTSTYAIAVKDAVPPATIASSASLTQFDSNELQGTKGSGTLLAQSAAAVSAGLSGSYAYGLQGDTPCLPTCGLGVIAGPAAVVGQFVTDGAGHFAGTQDANVATANFASAPLTGTYSATDVNGRAQLTLVTTATPTGIYPTDYVAYVVDANQAFILSTDKHSSFILLSGAAARQQTGTFNKMSFSGPYVGYENAQTNPGLLGTTLQNVANFSTATIFRGVGDGNGTCNTTNIDQGGVTALVNNLTGLGSGVNVLNALLGTYQSTGNSTCLMSSNGRGVLSYPAPNSILTSTLQLLGLAPNPPSPRVVYMYGPNQGFFLETGYAGLGRIEPQTGSPFSLSTLSGTYVYRTAPASTVASITSSGVFALDGAGSGASDLDMNIGVGTINVLRLGVTGNFNYTLTDSNAGRFVLGSPTIAYAISPSRLVLLDTSVATTSPSVAVMYNSASSVVIY